MYALLFFTFSDEIPKNCCVPLCTKKLYVEGGEKISYFRFPKDKKRFDEWIHAIRRDVGREFQVNENTRICSKHFKCSDYNTSLTGIRTLTDSAAPSIFEWKEASPKKRKVPVRKSPRKSVKRSDDESRIAEPSTSHGLEEPVEEYSDELEFLQNKVEKLTATCSL